MNIFTVLTMSIIVFTAAPDNVQAQKSKKTIETIEFEVSGVCNSCKNRIENAALIKGVKSATWNKYTQLLIVSSRADKLKLEEIYNAVASCGHDTKHQKASDEAYRKLPKCCRYRDDIEVH